jgi:hypothetical protein
MPGRAYDVQRKGMEVRAPISLLRISGNSIIKVPQGLRHSERR